MKFWISSTFITLSLVAAIAQSAPVTGWFVVNPQTGGATTKSLAGASTDSPTLGNGSEDSASVVALYADISGAHNGAADVALANGEMVTLTGSATLSGISSSQEQFRWGLFNESASPFDASGWQGFIASNSAGSSGGALRAKPSEGGTFAQTGSAVNLQTAQDGDDFIDETYYFTMSVSRFNDEVSVNASLTSADDWTQVWKDVIAASPTPLSFNFNRVGFLSGNSLNANQISFNNIDVTTAPIDALTLQVFTAGPDAGKVLIRNNRFQNFEIEYYDIVSDSGSLNHDDWTSLDDQEGNDAELEGWEETAGNGAGLLSEYRMFSTLIVAPSSTLSLGKAFEVGSSEDLEFFVGLPDGTYLRGVVEYIAEDLTGDFNRDQNVDAADYVAWRKGHDGDYIPDDYHLWRAHFHESTGSGRSTPSSAPEPAGIVLLLLGIASTHNRLARPWHGDVFAW